jgi:zinc protease
MIEQLCREQPCTPPTARMRNCWRGMRHLLHISAPGHTAQSGGLDLLLEFRSPPMSPWRRLARATRPPSAVRQLIAAIALAHLSPADIGAQRTLDAVMQDTVLDNGLHVIVVPNPTVPLVTIQVTVRNGAFTQLTEADVGTPHLLEHMLFRSFGANGFGPEAAKHEAGYNGTTSDETVTYYVYLPSANLAKGIQLMADLMRSPRFERTALESEQQVVRGELERRAADPDWLLSAMVDQQLWGTGWGRKNTIGNVPSILGATPERLKQIYERFYVPNNAAVVITGDVAPAAAFTLAARHFSRWKRAGDPFAALTIPAMPRLEAHRQVTVPLEANDVTLLVRWQGPSVREDPAGAYAADLFSAIVNDPISDLQSRLVDTGLFHSVVMYSSTRAHVGEITLEAVATADQLVAASKALRAELAAFADPGYVTAEALEIAKKRQEVEWAIALETPSGLAAFIGELWSVAGLDYARGYLAAMKSQQEADLEKFVAAYVANRPRVTGVMLSRLTRHELGARLQEALAPWRN